MNMVHYMVMIKVNIHEAKARLSHFLARVAAGESVLICNRNVPVAELRPVPARRTRKRPIGLARGRLAVPAAFFDPLPEADVAAWEGRRP